MDSEKSAGRLLGAAFLLQAVTSLVSGAILLQPLMVPGNMVESMTNIANNAMLMRAGILGDMITALGIVFLGALLFATLRKQNEKMALVALGFYILEAALLAASRMVGFSLLRASQAYVTAGQPAFLQAMGSLASETMDFGYTLHMLPFCLGAMLFYYLFYKSSIIPRALSLWGLVTVTIALAATLLAILGYEVPFFVYLPYAPFEFVIGVWLLIKGFRAGSETG